jgi:hypothetical protein
MSDNKGPSQPVSGVGDRVRNRTRARTAKTAGGDIRRDPPTSPNGRAREVDCCWRGQEPEYGQGSMSVGIMGRGLKKNPARSPTLRGKGLGNLKCHQATKSLGALPWHLDRRSGCLRRIWVGDRLFPTRSEIWCSEHS